MHDITIEIIHYTMDGNAYSVAYNMHFLSYDSQLQKIVALGEEGRAKDGDCFTIFIYDITSTQVTIYK